ncbi:hypothetical protein E4T39_05771 [Aureobasidium subglaciale]|nr:hypothetical protein E4T39_05771 [Aureobasidium subglaciale]
MNALRHEGAAMCPRCKLKFCFKCSKDWKLCKATCKGGAAELLDKETEGKSPGVVKGLLVGLKEVLRSELQLLDRQKWSKKELATIKDDYEYCVSMIDQALQDDTSHAVFADVKEYVHGFLDPLRKKRGAPPLKETPAESLEEVQDKTSKKRALSPDPFLARFQRAKTGVHADVKDKHLEYEWSIVDGNDDEDGVAEDRNDSESDYEHAVEDEGRSEDNDEIEDDPDEDSDW